MIPLGSQKGLTFKARIRIGADIGHDFAWFSWPRCKGDGSGAWKAKDPDMWFTCEMISDDRYDCRAPGYGEKPYGNGSVFVYGLRGLDMLPADRITIFEHLKAEKEKRVAAKLKELTKLQNELEALQP